LAKQDTQKGSMKKGGARARKKQHKSISSGIVHVCATFNNTIISITDLVGNVISWASAGKCNFSGSRKSSAFAATVAAQDAAKAAMSATGLKEVEVNLKGPGAGRESAVRGLQSAGLIISLIRDKTPVPHNGCRPRKRRRV
jgi:small subunit ribosomal protein S11